QRSRTRLRRPVRARPQPRPRPFHAVPARRRGTPAVRPATRPVTHPRRRRRRDRTPTARYRERPAGPAVPDRARQGGGRPCGPIPTWAKPVQRPHPPISVGGESDRAIALRLLDDPARLIA